MKRNYGKLIYWLIPAILALVHHLIFGYLSSSRLMDCVIIGLVMILMRPVFFNIVRDNENSDDERECISLGCVFFFIVVYFVLSVVGVVTSLLHVLSVAYIIIVSLYVFSASIFSAFQLHQTKEQRVGKCNFWEIITITSLPLCIPNLIVNGFYTTILIYISIALFSGLIWIIKKIF